MKVRAITALFFVIIVLASILLNVYTFTVFFVIVSAYCLHEFYQMVSADGTTHPNRFLGLLLGLCSFGLYAGYALGSFSASYLLLAIPLVVFVFIAALYQKQEKPFLGIAYTLLGTIYAVLPFVAFFALGFIAGTYNKYIPLGFILILWGNDTGAYLVGRFFGKRRLFERISPKKTWEGFIGGVLLALITAFILAHYFPVLDTWQWIGMALIISVFGTLGDLVESMLKRSQQVKDSGSILPGHGGLLDRFDGLLLAAPMVLVFLEFILNQKVY